MNNVLKNKSYNFALRIVNLTKYLQEEKKEFILSKQILRSGTAIGALIAESEYAQSKSDFISKLHISIKEANETNYWLNLLKDSSYINDKMYKSLSPDLTELLKILTSSIKTAKENNV
ncbi:four helix bundle protein [Halarcobacter bivalviorum]|uniref:four helix bundle protein n=1 Tax=Halarcobacter bivalviorum TaxID=663364 RepID=UPI00100A5032|nr:four helix bundle protein [Halarcobacter bivalviorum]RXK06992.1 four helix bundle protein [Halarcobacter bivalviorum]